MSNLSRRDFLKGSLAGAASLAMAGVGLGAVNAKASAAGLYTPGNYSATATGMGTVTVTATFDENSIVDVVLDLAVTVRVIIPVFAFTVVFSFAGASLTSEAVRVALKNCIAQAKGEAVSSGSVKPTVESDGAYVLTDITAEDINASAVILEPITDFAEERDVDIVVCGAGASGVIAAVKAAEMGAKVKSGSPSPLLSTAGVPIASCSKPISTVLKRL